MIKDSVFSNDLNKNLFHFFSSDGKEKNKTVKQIFKRLNSNPASCDDIRKLDYTLNGYYLVNDSTSEVTALFGVVFCQFKLPPGTNRSTLPDMLIPTNCLPIYSVLDHVISFFIIICLVEEFGERIGFIHLVDHINNVLNESNQSKRIHFLS